jgi:tetratricopeptide (TPR) repeat protein
MIFGSSPVPAQNRGCYLVAAILALATVGVYWPVSGFESVNYDDLSYVFNNPVVNQGLTANGLAWAATTSWFDFWHPITWWSHMLDVELFGLRPGYHHVVNVGFHVANTLLLFWVFQRMTGAVFRSGLVAGLFALHPMHVESVAWIAERKDVLSTFFGLWCLHAYVSYTALLSQGSPLARQKYFLVLGLFACALMSKASFVTWPFVLLLVDVWPLNRTMVANQALSISRLWPLVVEKWPFFGLTVASSLITYLGMQSQENIMSAERVSWFYRLTNVPVSYLRYIAKLIWPADLAVLYPISEPWPVWLVVFALVAVGAISVVVVCLLNRMPFVAVGWFVFIGTLVPMIGIVAMGNQSIADRYSYVPSIGLFVAVVWGVAHVFEIWRVSHRFAAGLAVGILTAYGVVCSNQIQHWRDSESLWRKCLSVETENAIAHYNLGHVLQQSGRAAEALPHYQAAVRIKPDYLDAHLNLGVISFESRDFAAATNHFHAALTIKPDYLKAHGNLGLALIELRDFAGASNHLAQAVAADPARARNRCLYALALVELGNAPAAIAEATAALQSDGNNGVAFALLGRAHALRGEVPEARQMMARALQLSPDVPEVRFWAGLEAAKQGDYEVALLQLEMSLTIKTDWAEAHYCLATVHLQQGNVAKAVEHNRKAIESATEWPEPLNNLAWLLATTPQAELRNGPESVELARRACKLTGYRQPRFIGTLAAALAESGQFEAAVATAEQAAALARELGLNQLAATNDCLREQFKDGQPHRAAR